MPPDANITVGADRTIVPATGEHAIQMADLHHKYVRSLLRDLGKRMCVVFYRHALDSGNNFGFVCIADSRVVGFVLGTRDNSRLFSSFRVRLALVLALCKRPGLLRRILAHFSNRFPPGPELAYIAVDPEFQGRGIGKQLAQAQHDEYRRRHVGCYEVRIDHDNAPSLAIHKSLGAEVTERFREGNTCRLRMKIEVRDDARTSGNE